MVIPRDLTTLRASPGNQHLPTERTDKPEAPYNRGRATATEGAGHRSGGSRGGDVACRLAGWLPSAALPVLLWTTSKVRGIAPRACMIGRRGGPHACRDQSPGARRAELPRKATPGSRETRTTKAKGYTSGASLASRAETNIGWTLPQSTRTEPAQSLRGRVVVDAEVLCDPADAGASVVHRGADGGDNLVDRDHERIGNANVGEETTEGSESFSPRPPPPTPI